MMIFEAIMKDIATERPPEPTPFDPEDPRIAPLVAEGRVTALRPVAPKPS